MDEDEKLHPDRPPAEITHLVRERTEARTARDWERADELKAQIEEAGWKVVDHGSRSTVHRAAPADKEVGEERRYGSRRTVPSRLHEPAESGFTVVTVASEAPARVRALAAGLATTAPAGTQLVIVVNDPMAAQEADLPELLSTASANLEVEAVRTAVRLGYAAALNIGLERAGREFVVIADATAAPDADALSGLAAAFADPDVAVAGGFGLAATGPTFSPSRVERTGSGAVTAVELAWLAFRRSDYVNLGPLDEGFVVAPWLDVWWSLGLRSGDDPEREPRRALALDLPLVREAPPWPPERTRFARRNAYRVIDTFAADRRLVIP